MSTTLARTVFTETPVGLDALANISANAEAIRAKAMELTDSWAGVMFALSPEDLEEIAVAVGFERSVAAKIHGEVRGLAYAHISGAAGTQPIATYHAMDASFMALRGITDFGRALSRFTDDNLELVLDAYRDTFRRIEAALPDYSKRMNFAPETAAAVLRSFGADVSPDVLYTLASKYHTSVVDLEGRRGVTVTFIRCVTLTLASTL